MIYGIEDFDLHTIEIKRLRMNPVSVVTAKCTDLRNCSRACLDVIRRRNTDLWPS